MEKTIVTFDTAKLAKEKGFIDKYPINCYNQDGLFMPQTRIYQGLPAPTQSILQKWLRENYDLHIIILPCYVFAILNKEDIESVDNGDSSIYDYVSDESFSSYEEALELALINTLHNI